MDILRRHSIRAMHTRNAVKIKKYTENTILRDLLSATLPSSLNSFLPRDAMQARPMPSRGVHLSVCLSVCHVRELCLPHRRRRISESLFITTCSMHDHDEKKRTQQNVLIRSGKSEAGVTYCNRRLRSTNYTT